MFTRVETRNFLSLQAVDQSLGGFRALVGPNATGKTTFLDIFAFLSDLMTFKGDVRRTIQARSSIFEKLLWKGLGRDFELAVEAEIPESVKACMTAEKQVFNSVRYELRVAFDDVTNETGLSHETLWLCRTSPLTVSQRSHFPQSKVTTTSICSSSSSRRKMAVTKNPKGNDNYYPDGRESYKPSFRLGRTVAALANLPALPETFPVSSWFRDTLERGVQAFVLNSHVIRQPSPPGLGRQFKSDGSNLPWVIAELRKDTVGFAKWLAHVQTALEDIRDIDTIEREEDRHRYLVIEYANGARVPSWLASDGTLRLLALTIPAYLRDLEGMFLIEEPENGIHPRAIETVLQSLRSMYRSQVLVATHSPIALNMLEPRELLCFAKDESGATDVISGDQHPALLNWQAGEPDLGLLFASGILS